MRRHAPVAEYDAYLERSIDDPVHQRMLRHARDEFLAHYPDLETWFAAPLLERVGRERRDGVRSSCKTLGYQARSYLHYLGLSGYAWFDWEWLLAVARHRIWELDARLGLTLRHDVNAFIEEAVRLGYSSHARQSIFWAVSRIVLHAGDPRVSAIDETQVEALVEAVRRFGDRSDVALFHGSVARYQRLANKGFLTHIHALRVVLYHRGQATTKPRRNHRPSGQWWPVHKPRMQAVLARFELLRLRGHGGSQWSDRQTPIAQSHIGELVVGQQVGHLRHLLIDLLTLLLEISLARGLRMGLSQFAPGGLGRRHSLLAAQFFDHRLAA